MIRLFALLLGLMLLVPRLGAAAEPLAAQLTPEQAGAALEVLNDPQKRAAFAATLKAIMQGTANAPKPAAEPAPAPAPAPALVVWEPDSLGAQLLLRVSRFLTHSSDSVIAALEAVQSVPLLWGWLQAMLTSPLGQEVLTAIGWRLLLALACGLGLGLVLHRAVRGPRARLRRAALALVPEPVSPEDRAEAGDIEAPPPSTTGLVSSLERYWLALARCCLAALPAFGLWIAGHLAIAFARGGPEDTRLVIAAVLWAAALSDALVRTLRILLAPEEPRLRLVPLEDRAAAALMRSLCQLLVVGICGYAFAEVGLLLGLSLVAHEALLRVVGLAVTLGLGMLVIGQRRAVSGVLRAPEGATGPVARIRNSLASAWHWLALTGLAVLWVLWVADEAINPAIIGRLAGLTVLVLGAARLMTTTLLGIVDRLPAVSTEDTTGQPRHLLERLQLYHPVLSLTVRFLVHGLAIAVLLQIYGVGTLSWLWGTPSGQRVISSAVTLGVTILVAITGWELINAAIQRHLAALLKDAQAAKSSRLRTLLPVLRTGLLIVICIVSILMVLSEIGVNIAPLMAGAGIVGVAIGFGSQKLVQDLITGLFLLLENALQIGDIVNVSGLSGTVEALSVRTISLRAVDGALHIVPFSGVTSVTNYSRGFGNADVRVMVEYNTDTDRVAEVLRGIVAEMRTEPAFAGKIVKDFVLWGVERIDLNGVTISGQVACTDSGRWSVQREINRRIKLRFEELGILFFNQNRPLPAVPNGT